MKIKWYGHSSFLLRTQAGVRLFTDPCGPYTGYVLKDIIADAVTISHSHSDHDYLGAFSNTPHVINSEGLHEFKGIRITGIPSYHDESSGKERGTNLIFLFEFDGLRVAHLGDLGDLPTDDAYAQLDKLDVLLAPVGGTYTIGPSRACEIACKTQTNIFIPMHYQTPTLTLEKKLLGVESTLSIAKGWHIHKLNQNEAVITKESLGENRLLVFDYAK